MLIPSHDSASGVAEPPGDFKCNYQHLKMLINTALKEGTPLEELHLVPRDSSLKMPNRLSKQDLIKLLHTLRRIRSRYQRLLQSPVPAELVRDIRAKAAEDRLPWETEALEKHEQWQADVSQVRAQVQKELNDHLISNIFRED